ncbi:MAG: N5,N10-methylene tetrahydromethanopterin reductase [Candidatus Tectimicrobiota bacterium]|nr:MAG: N5,N10-methylene tetrahydromethanopterin reductase [Candidatus Tectomicrobia bacterium]
MSAKVQLGILLPTRGVLFAGEGAPDLSPIYTMAAQAEAAGYHSLWVGDSITAKPRLEALTTLAALAARTQRIRLGTAVLLAALRPPLVLAHAVASLDVLAGGRLILGVGAGRGGRQILAAEFENCGVPFGERGPRLSELLQICRRLWQGEPLTYQGTYYRLSEVVLEPRPVQPGGPPLWIASNFIAQGLERVGRLGDGWITNVTSPEVYRRCWERIAAVAEQHGRDPQQLERCLYLTVNVHPDGDVARREGRSFLESYYKKPAAEVEADLICQFGSPAEVLERLAAYVRLGVRTVIVRFATPRQLEQLQICTETLLPQVARL